VNVQIDPDLVVINDALTVRLVGIGHCDFSGSLNPLVALTSVTFL
jgi:hypothetical protein